MILLGILIGWGLSAEGKALVPVGALTLSESDQQTLLAASPPTIHTVTHPAVLVWQGNPLPLDLPLHQEKRLIFSEPVQVDVNGQLTTDQLRIINDHQNVYLTALSTFPKTTRIYITLKNSGQIIFFDVNTTNRTNRTHTTHSLAKDSS